MAYLQLADNAENEIFSHLAESDPMDLYLFVPTDEVGNGKYVREDYFDDLDPQAWSDVMDFLEPYQNPGVNGIWKRMKERRLARKDARALKKESKMNRKNIRTQSKADARTQRTSGGGFMDKVGGIVGGLFNKTPIDAGFDIQSGQAPQFYAKGASKWYATTGGKIGIGVGALVLGVGIYKLTQKK